jgi:cytochrome P450
MLIATSFQLVIFVIQVILAYIAWIVFEATTISPLKDIPGPFAAKLTQWWLIFTDLAGDRTTTIHELHKKYGPAVRIGPNEVSFANIESVKEIYGQATVYMKAPIYDTFSLPPLGIFSMRDKREHAQRRRLLAHAFSQANLYDTEPLIMKKIEKTALNIQDSNGRAINVLALFRSLALDIVGELFLGQSFGALDQPEPPAYLDDVDRHFLMSGIDANFPLLYKILSRLPIAAVQHFFASRQRIYQYGHDAFFDYVKRNGRKSTRKDLLTKILVSSSSDDAPMTDEETFVEVGNLVFAGTDTTSSTLTYLFWELARNQEWQDRLRKELSNADMTYQSLKDLPILDALVNEGLRLHPAAPASLQRIVPAGGGQLGGNFIPANTIVSMQCYTTQRDPVVFPGPDVFAPDRWLTKSGPSEEMKALFMPFSKGTRACLGIHLAMMELKLTTAALIRDYVVAIAENMKKSDMDMKDHFLVLPAGGKCDLVFTPRKRE